MKSGTPVWQVSFSNQYGARASFWIGGGTATTAITKARKLARRDLIGVLKFEEVTRAGTIDG